MLALDRRKEILKEIELKESVRVQDLSEKFKVSEETIRRDLDKLEKDGFVKRTYGGAVYNKYIKSDIPFDVRQIQNIYEKQKIAEEVIDYIHDGDTIMLDSSSTTLQLAKIIKDTKKNITIVTNSVPLTIELANNENIDLISTGGTLRHSSVSFVGDVTVSTLKKYNVDKAIISCKGIDKDKGVMESSESEGAVKKQMIESAKEVYLLIDERKIDKFAFYNMMDLKEIDRVFTDSSLNKEWIEFLKNNKIKYNIIKDSSPK